MNENAGWDVVLPSITRSKCLKLAKEMYELEQISFDRSIVPVGYDAAKKPMLLLLSDGSDTGQCTVAYLRWEMTGGLSHRE